MQRCGHRRICVVVLDGALCRLLALPVFSFVDSILDCEGTLTFSDRSLDLVLVITEVLWETYGQDLAFIDRRGLGRDHVLRRRRGSWDCSRAMQTDRLVGRLSIRE